uniref:Tumor suppressor 2, mitochondrial calcium regulator n=1 Tax=Fundulus heteroclitus TaxID=8078 RepID=A0A3Q2UM68_FUNHE
MEMCKNRVKGCWQRSCCRSSPGISLSHSVQSGVMTSCFGSSLYYDEDGDLAHEFYEETVVTKNGRKRSKLKRIQKNLIPQGIVKLDQPCIHVDFPVVLCEG